MKIAATMIVRNEDWCLGATIPVALQWCDELIVLDHGSTDTTHAILAEFQARYPNRVIVQRHTRDKCEWPEMRMRARALSIARTRGATHIAVVDADEAVTANLIPHMRNWCFALDRGCGLVLGMVTPYDGLDRLRTDGYFGERTQALVAFRDDGLVNWNPGDDGYELHSRTPRHLRRAVQTSIKVPHDDGGMTHLQFSSMRRLKAKAAWYKVLECVQHPGRETAAQLNTKYDWTLQAAHGRYRPTPPEWLSNLDRSRLHLDAEPWQERELRALVCDIEAGRVVAHEQWRQLDLHGLV